MLYTLLDSRKKKKILNVKGYYPFQMKWRGLYSLGSTYLKNAIKMFIV